MIISLFVFLLTIIIFGFIAVVYIGIYRAAVKGYLGEDFVSTKLKELDSEKFRVINNLLISSDGRLTRTQVDHVVVSNYGIFCIETKNHKGWILGHAKQKYWTQAIYSSKYPRRTYKIYNPLWQNFGHIKAIENLIKDRFPNIKIFSFVAFPSAKRIIVKGTDLVGHTRDVVEKIKKHNKEVISDDERDEIYDILVNACLKDDESIKNHKMEVSLLKEKEETLKSI